MRKILPVLLLLAAIPFLSGCLPSLGFSPTEAPSTFTPLPPLEQPLPTATLLPTPETAPALTASQVRNAAYTLEFLEQDGLTVQLVEGVYEDAVSDAPKYIHMGDLIALGDLNGDGLGDAAATVGENYGGSGVFTSLVVYLNQEGAPFQAASIRIDDRPMLTDLRSDAGQILLSGAIHSFEDPACCPSMNVVRTYRFTSTGLVLFQQTHLSADGAARTITINSPAGGESASGSLRVTGEVTIAPFENNLTYIIFDAENHELQRGPFAVSASDMGQPGTFDNTLDLSALPTGQTVRLELHEMSMADGSTLAMTALEIVLK